MKKIIQFLLLTLALVFAISLSAEEVRYHLKPITIQSSEGTGVTTATTTTLVSGVENKKIIIFKVYLQNVSATETLVQLQEEDGDIFFEQNLAQGQPVVFNFGDKVVRLTSGKSLELITSNAGDIRWTVGYDAE